uniref:Uncharacterized protein n=1 Tax=Callorhinchus milii TaxID=7868 RepID=A0A4W3GQZ9_CALMI
MFRPLPRESNPGPLAREARARTPELQDCTLMVCVCNGVCVAGLCVWSRWGSWSPC